MALTGRHLGGGDGRPAHFIHIHAQQLVPMAVFALQRMTGKFPGVALAMFGLGYLAVWAWLAALGLRPARRYSGSSATGRKRGMLGPHLLQARCARFKDEATQRVKRNHSLPGYENTR